MSPGKPRAKGLLQPQWGLLIPKAAPPPPPQPPEPSPGLPDTLAEEKGLVGLHLQCDPPQGRAGRRGGTLPVC